MTGPAPSPDAADAPTALPPTSATGAALWPLALLLLGALLLRLRAWSNTGIMMNDGVDFLWQAQRWLEGDGAAAVSHPYHPLYGATIAAAARIFGGELVDTAAGVSIFGGLLLVAAAWGLGRLAFPDTRWGGPCAGLLAAVHTRTLSFSSDVQAEGLSMGLFGVAAWALWAALVSRRPVPALLGAGLLTGISALARQEGLLLCLPVALLFVLGRWRGVRPAPRLSGVAAFGLGVALALAPYVGFIHSVTGLWAVSMKPSMTNMGLGGTGYDARVAILTSPLASPRVPELDSKRPRRVLERTRYWRPRPDDLRRGGLGALPGVAAPAPGAGGGDTLDDMAEGPVVVLAKWASGLRGEGLILLVAGLGLTWRRRRGLVLMWGALTAAYLSVCAVHVAAADFISDRHMLPAIIVSLPLMGAGFARMAAARPGARGHALSHAILPGLLGLMLVSLVDSGSGGQRDEAGAHLAALDWVEHNRPVDEGIGVFKRRDGWYANRHVLLIDLPYPDDLLLDSMQRFDIGCLVLDHEHVEEDAPHWLAGQGFRVVARFPSADGDRDTETLVLEPASG